MEGPLPALDASDGGYVTAAKSGVHAGRAGSDGTPMNVHPSLNVTGTSELSECSLPDRKSMPYFLADA